MAVLEIEAVLIDHSEDHNVREANKIRSIEKNKEAKRLAVGTCKPLLFSSLTGA